MFPCINLSVHLTIALPPIFELRVTVEVVGGGGVGMECVGERRDFTGDTATERGTGEVADGVGVVGLLPPLTFF